MPSGVIVERGGLLAIATGLIASGTVMVQTGDAVSGAVLLLCGLGVIVIREHFKANGRWIRNRKR